MLPLLRNGALSICTIVRQTKFQKPMASKCVNSFNRNHFSNVCFSLVPTLPFSCAISTHPVSGIWRFKEIKKYKSLLNTEMDFYCSQTIHIFSHFSQFTILDSPVTNHRWLHAEYFILDIHWSCMYISKEKKNKKSHENFLV